MSVDCEVGVSEPEGCLLKQQLQNTWLPRTDQDKATPTAAAESCAAVPKFITKQPGREGASGPLWTPSAPPVPSPPFACSLAYGPALRDLEEMGEGICLLQSQQAGRAPPVRPEEERPSRI